MNNIYLVSPRKTLQDGTLESLEEWGKRCAKITNLEGPKWDDKTIDLSQIKSNIKNALKG